MASKTPLWLRRSRRKFGSWLMPQVAPFVMRRLSRSWRTELVGEEHYLATREYPGCLLTIWHGRMVLGLAHHADRDFTVLVSPSKDGDLMDTLLPRFGYGVIRGSSSRTGARALREMLRSLRVGGTVVVTPDGPRGPRHSGSAGVVWLARATGYPVLPMGMVADRAWRMKSWDAFTLPKWRARVALVYGRPIFVARDADEATLKAAAEDMRLSMLEAEARGFEQLGVTPDWPDEDLARLDEIRAWRPDPRTAEPSS